MKWINQLYNTIHRYCFSIILFISCCAISMLMSVTYAAPTPTPSTANPLRDLQTLTSGIYNILLPVFLAFGFFSIVSAGYQLKTSEGNPQMTKEGWDNFREALLGMLFVVLSLVIFHVIMSLLFTS